jgi:hypothetical protein
MHAWGTLASALVPTSTDNVHTRMVCTQCDSFCSETFAKAQVPESTHRSGDVVRTTHVAVLHQSVHELRQVSDSRCRICQLIYF